MYMVKLHRAQRLFRGWELTSGVSRCGSVIRGMPLRLYSTTVTHGNACISSHVDRHKIGLSGVKIQK